MTIGKIKRREFTHESHLLAAVNAKYIHSNLAVYSVCAPMREKPMHSETRDCRVYDQPARWMIFCRIFTGRSRIFCAFPAISGISVMWSSLMVEIKKVLPAIQYLAWRPGGFLQCGTDAGSLSTAGWYYARGRGRDLSGTAAILSW